MPAAGSDARTPFPQQNWEFLFQQTLLFADYQVRRLHWRGAANGLLPDGYDANCLAAQAFLEFLVTNHLNPDFNLNPDPPLEEILYELKGLVLKLVTRLHHRKENYLLCNADDLVPVQIDDDDFINPIELIPDLNSAPDNVLLEKESLICFESSKSRFASFIKRDRCLGSLFELMSDGVEKPRALAVSLKLAPATVRNLRKRLRRRWRRCFPDFVSKLA